MNSSGDVNKILYLDVQFSLNNIIDCSAFSNIRRKKITNRSINFSQTDVTNASRTMLMNLETLQWDHSLCSFFRIPPKILPKIKSCSEIYGFVYDGPLQGVPIASVITEIYFNTLIIDNYKN